MRLYVATVWRDLANLGFKRHRNIMSSTKWKQLLERPKVSVPFSCHTPSSVNNAKLTHTDCHTHTHTHTHGWLVSGDQYPSLTMRTRVHHNWSRRNLFSTPQPEWLPQMRPDRNQLLPAASPGPRNECRSSPSPASCSSCRCGQWETALWFPSAKEAHLSFRHSSPCAFTPKCASLTLIGLLLDKWIRSPIQSLERGFQILLTTIHSEKIFHTVGHDTHIHTPNEH